MRTLIVLLLLSGPAVACDTGGKAWARWELGLPDECTPPRVYYVPQDMEPFGVPVIPDPNRPLRPSFSAAPPTWLRSGD